MAIETQPERAEPTGRGPEPAGAAARPWWMRPGAHTGVIGAVIGYFLGHWLGNFLGGDYARSSLSDTNDVAIVLGYAFAVIGWLAGLGVFNDLGCLMLGRPLPEEPRLLGKEEPGLGKYFRYTLDHKVVGIQYLYGMIAYFLTGGLFAMAIRSELLSPTLPPHRPGAVPDGGRRARHDDDDDDVLGHPRAVRPVLRPAADRLQAGRVPAAGGARLLAHPGRLRHPAVRRADGRIPHRLDRVRAAGHPGHAGHGRLLLRVRPDGHLDDPGRLQHDRHHHQLPGPRHALEPAARCSSGRCSPCRSCRCWRCRCWSARATWASPTGPSRPRSSPTSSAAAATCTRTCSGSSAIPRCTSWPCPASASSPRWSRCSAASRCSATRSPRPACSASASCPSSSGSITCSTAGSTRTCGRCSCSPPS